MSDTAIKAEQLGKTYRIGHRRTGYTALRDVLPQMAKGMVRAAADMARGRELVAGDEVEDFWALKDVSFEIKKGEVVGVIGRNGAGKSTLLKVLSRITEPSTGRVAITGRVASLLEVGTGFHPELTGRENIFLNGAILGMSRSEIRRRFDEIVAFAEVEKFLDTPCKRYSSGMYVRLAFAVAAHLEAEILLVDEVLAVGDAEFQKKCLGKMEDVSKQGRTVLFVSHNLTMMQNICQTGLLLRGGQAVARGPIDDVVQSYWTRDDQLVDLRARRDRSGNGACRLTGFRMLWQGEADGGERQIVFDFEYESDRPQRLRLLTDMRHRGSRVMMFDSDRMAGVPELCPPSGVIRVTLDAAVGLTAGAYTTDVALYANHELSDYVQEAATFEVEEVDFFGNGTTLTVHGAHCVLPRQTWSVVGAEPRT